VAQDPRGAEQEFRVRIGRGIWLEQVAVGGHSQLGHPALGVRALGDDVPDPARNPPEAAGPRVCWLVHDFRMTDSGERRQWQ
jgi:hypothetical protein